MSNLTYNATYLPASSLSFFLSSDMTNTNYTRGLYATPLKFWSRSGLTGKSKQSYLLDFIQAGSYIFFNSNIVRIIQGFS